MNVIDSKNLQFLKWRSSWDVLIVLQSKKTFLEDQHFFAEKYEKYLLYSILKYDKIRKKVTVVKNKGDNESNV